MIPIILSAAALVILSFMVGLLIGWKARDIYEKLSGLYGLWEDRIETPAGVVKLERRKVTRYQDTNPDSEAGGVMRPRPSRVISDDENIAQNIMQQNRNLR